MDFTSFIEEIEGADEVEGAGEGEGAGVIEPRRFRLSKVWMLVPLE